MRSLAQRGYLKGLSAHEKGWKVFAQSGTSGSACTQTKYLAMAHSPERYSAKMERFAQEQRQDH